MNRKAIAAPPWPPANFNKKSIPIANVGPHDWFRIFRNDSPKSVAKHFGRKGSGRFDAVKRNYGVLYLADSIHCCFVEIWGRDPDPKADLEIDEGELPKRSLAVFKSKTLRVADLSGDGLSRLGLDVGISATRRYDITRAWSVAIHSHPARADGIRYRSRLDPSFLCLALFERAGHKVRVVSEERLDTRGGRLMLRPSFKKYHAGLVSTGMP